MKDEKVIFGERLVRIRKEHGESQQKLADSLGITRSSMSRYETGTHFINADLLLKIAKHYNISADSILGIDNNPKEADYLRFYMEFSRKALIKIIDASLEYKEAAVSIEEISQIMDGVAFEMLKGV